LKDALIGLEMIFVTEFGESGGSMMAISIINGNPIILHHEITATVMLRTGIRLSGRSWMSRLSSWFVERHPMPPS
jgi:hypothetical protein